MNVTYIIGVFDIRYGSVQCRFSPTGFDNQIRRKLFFDCIDLTNFQKNDRYLNLSLKYTKNKKYYFSHKDNDLANRNIFLKLRMTSFSEIFETKEQI